MVKNLQSLLVSVVTLRKDGVRVPPGRLAGVLIRQLRRRIHSNETGFGFRYQFSEGIEDPVTPLKAQLRKQRPGDLARFFDFVDQRCSRDDFGGALERLTFARSGVGQGYIGVTGKDRPCVINWLMTSRDNAGIRAFFGDGIPPLQSDEALCEFVFTHPSFRGHRLAQWITLQLWREAAEQGCSRVMVIVHGTNETSLAVTRRIGFQPIFRKEVRWLLFARRVTFVELGHTRSRPGLGSGPLDVVTPP